MTKKNPVETFINNFDVIIIGAGAAGLMCALTAGKRGRKVLLLDHSPKIGEKIRISGGGRCNFTNLKVTPENFLSANPHFSVSALKRFTANDFISLVQKHGITFHEKTLGQLFCDNSAQQIIKMLLDECAENGVEIHTETKVTNLEKSANNFLLDVENSAPTNAIDESGEVEHSMPCPYTCTSLVIATGGLSIPKIGATDFGFRIAKKFGLKIIPPLPALVPFTLADDLLAETKNLAGVSVAQIKASCNKKTFTEDLLFTHKGLSGPVILQISSYWNFGDVISLNLLPKIDVFSWLLEEKKQGNKQEISNLIATILPKKLAIYLTEKSGLNGSLAEISNQKLAILGKQINDWKIIPSGTEGFLKAEVTKGGIDTAEISSKTFEAKKTAGLFFIGEVLDVTGHLGGFNFQWAWSSGFAAGQFV